MAKAKKAAKPAAKKKLRAAVKAGDFNKLAAIAAKPGRLVPPTPPPPAPVPVPVEAKLVPFGSVSPSPLNPRRQASKEGLRALADSIKAEGILQSLLVRPKASDHGAVSFEIIAGERRWRAVELNIKDGSLPRSYVLPVRVRAATDAELVELAGTENMGREDMHPLDEAAVIAAMRKYHKDDGEIARRLGIPERTLYRRVALLRLADELKEDLRAGKITLQQAAAFSLGGVKQQRDHRERMTGTSGEYYRDPSQIRRSMTEKAIPAKRALFPLAHYDGEWITDPDTGDRYFADKKLFEELQEAAIKAKVDGLKKQWPWVKKIESYEQASYRKAPKGDAAAGAIYWDGGLYDDGFHVREGVLKPAESRKQEETERAEKQSAFRAAAVEEDRAAEELAEKVAAHLRDNPSLALAVATVKAISRFCWYDFPGDTLPPRVAVMVELLEPLLRPVITLADDETFQEWLEEVGKADDPEEITVYRVLAALPPDELLRLFVIASNGADELMNHDGLNELGMHVMQRELPLEAPAAEAAA